MHRRTRLCIISPDVMKTLRNSKADVVHPHSCATPGSKASIQVNTKISLGGEHIQERHKQIIPSQPVLMKRWTLNKEAKFKQRVCSFGLSITSRIRSSY